MARYLKRFFSSFRHAKLEGDHLLRASCLREDLEVFSIKADDLVREAQRRHNASPTAAAVLGRLMMGTLLMNSIFPEAHIFKMSLVGSGPIGYANGLSTDRTFAKAMVQFPQCELPLNHNGKVDMKTALGNCELHLICDFGNEKSTLYKFNVGPTGELAEALSFFMREEEKVDTVAAFGVTFDKAGIVHTARGFMIQVYPFSDKASCNQLLKNISNLPSFYDTSFDMDGQELIFRLLDKIPMGQIDDPIIPQFGPCSYEALAPEMKEALAKYSLPTLKKLVADKDHLDVFCVYTKEKIRLDKSVLESALRQAEEMDKLSSKQQQKQKPPEEKWLDFKANYVGKKAFRNLEDEYSPGKPVNPKYNPILAAADEKPSKSSYGEYKSIFNRMPPIDPFPPTPKRQPVKKRALRRRWV